MIPFLGTVVPLPYKILAGVLLIGAVAGFGYVKGYTHAENKYELEKAKFAADSERKFNELLIKKNKVDIQVVTEYVEKKVYITKWRERNAGLIDEIPTRTVCDLPNGWVSIHNSSANGLYADATQAADGTPSGINTSEALGGIIQNYGTCHETAEQLKSLQKWIREQGKLVEKSNGQ
jgi:hypothetical protein